MSYLNTLLYVQFDVLQMTYCLRDVHGRGMYHVTSLSYCSGNTAKSPPPPARFPTDVLGVASPGDAGVPLPKVAHTRDVGL
jgi:hypothetical protein